MKSRLAKRLKTGNYAGKYSFENPNAPPEPEFESLNDEQLSYAESLAQEYDRLQNKAQEYEKEQLKQIEAENPHQLRADMIRDPTPKGVYEMTLMGRKIDLSMLENYVLKKISPKSVITKMRYDNAKTYEEMKGYAKKQPIKINTTLILIIAGLMGLFAIGTLLFFLSPDLGSALRGLFGGV